MYKKKIIFTIFLGALFGYWFTVSAPTLFVCLAFIFTLFFIWYCTNESKDFRFIFYAALTAFILRAVFLLVYYVFYLKTGQPDILAPDGEVFSLKGWYISRLLLGGKLLTIPSSEYIFNDYLLTVNYHRAVLPPLNSYQIGILPYFYGFIYALFGYYPLTIKLLNCAFSVLTAVTVYFMAKKVLRDALPAKIATTISLFIPSMFIFSTTATKDPLFILILTLTLLVLTKFFLAKWRNSWLSLLLTIPLIGILELLRKHIIFGMAFFVLLVVLAKLKTHLFLRLFLLISLILFIANFGPVKRFTDPALLFDSHCKQVNEPGYNYRILPPHCYVGSQRVMLANVGLFEISYGLINGFFHVMFEPLPYRLGSSTQFFLFILSLPWFVISFFTGFGLFLFFTQSQRSLIPAFLFFAIFLFMLITNEGNVGTLFRHRDFLMPVSSIFASYGIAYCLREGA